MNISAVVVLTGNLAVTGTLNLLPGFDAKDAVTQITGVIKGLVEGGQYRLNISQSGDIGTVTAGAGGVTAVELSAPIELIGPHTVIGHTLTVFDSQGTRIAWGVILAV